MIIHSLWPIPISIVGLWIISVGLTRLYLSLRAYKFIMEAFDTDKVNNSDYEEIFYTTNSNSLNNSFLHQLARYLYRK